MSLINVSHLTFAYEGSYDNIFEDVFFELTPTGVWVLSAVTAGVKLLFLNF